MTTRLSIGQEEGGYNLFNSFFSLFFSPAKSNIAITIELYFLVATWQFVYFNRNSMALKNCLCVYQCEREIIQTKPIFDQTNEKMN